MDAKKIRKNIGYFFGWVALNSCLFISKFTPRPYIYKAASVLACLVYRIAAKHRKTALEGLSFAFGKEKSPEEITRIAKECFTIIAKSGIELLYLLEKPEQFKAAAVFQGEKYLKDCLARGKGVILVSAHFGNFPLLMGKLSLEGYKLAGIMRPMRDPRAEKFFAIRREIFKIKTIHTVPRKACVENSIRSLRNNELLFVLMDQNFGTAGVFVDFFGRKAATATGPVVLAQRTGAALLPCFIVRQPDNTHKVIFEPPIFCDSSKLGQQEINAVVQKITDIIEKYVRQYPSMWGWIHRRWKTKMSGE